MLATLDLASPSKATAAASANSQGLSDDEIAATQQSMLEELHAISEEALVNKPQQISERIESFPPHPSQDVQTFMDGLCTDEEGSDIADQKNSDSQPSIQEDAGRPTMTAANKKPMISPPQVIGLNVEVEATIAVPIATDTAKLELSSYTEVQTADTMENVEGGAGTPDPSSAEAYNAAEAHLRLAPQRSLSFSNHLPDNGYADPGDEGATTELPDVQTSSNQMDVPLGFDHADLFDGIEADAFDDIELSPPARRRVSLPASDGGVDNRNHIEPPSPNWARASDASQLLADAAFDNFGPDDADIALEHLPQASQMKSFLDPCFAGFQTGHGQTVKLSEKALQAAHKLLLDLEETTDLIPPTQPHPVPSQRRPLVPTSTHPVAGYEVNARDPSLLASRAPLQEIVSRQSIAVANDSERTPLATNSKVVAAQAVSTQQGLAFNQNGRPPFTTPKPTRSSLLNNGLGLATPTRGPPAASGSRFTTPQPSKRISLGVLAKTGSGSSTTGKKRLLPKFVTPFKLGKRPRAEIRQDLTSPLRGLQSAGNHDVAMASPLSIRQYASTRKPTSHAVQGPVVFRMQSDGPRHRLADIGRPEHYSSMQMIAKGVPDEVLVILNDASKASHYAFEGPEGALLMQQQALDELLARGCSAANMAWLQNHWALILWKLAALVRLEPSSAPERWSWSQLIRQLLYRYEREVHLAQRSCLKRIQEHDSSPARPMVLLVSKILEEETEIQERSGEVVVRKSTILELSDGWYRIQAQVDPVLANACQRGRLRIGQKLAVMGAKLDTAGEGNEVLAAYHMSSLILAANSVSLARWDAKLGFSARPFCASLRSLTPEGGLVSLMDVVLTKIYPLAYIDADRGSFNPSAARGEQEEAEAREAWVKKREDAIQQLQLQAESENGRLYDLVDALSDLASDTFLPAVPEDPSGRLMALANQLFDQLTAQPSPASAVKDMVVAAGHASLAPWLYNLAKSAILAGEGIGGSRLSEDLDRLCPPRKVREFRIVMFKDARLPSPPPATVQQLNANGTGPKKKNPYARSVHLTVYDAAQLGDELREGRRFLVTNLAPSEKSAWRKADDPADISLCTRRDTTWRPLS